MGLCAKPILSCSKAVDPSAIVKLFISAIRFATSSPPKSMHDLKASAQEQLDYLLTEDEDAPLLIADDEVKSEAKQYTGTLFSRFVNLVDLIVADVDYISDAGNTELFQMYLSDLLWASQILMKLESVGDFIATWVELSPKMVKIPEQAFSGSSSTAIKLKVLEVTGKVLDAIVYGKVILSTGKRLQMIEIWLPFVRSVKWAVDLSTSDEDNEMLLKFDREMWQSLESSFVLTILTLPSTKQPEILIEWLESKCARYPDLTDAFELWCYRSKVARRKLGFVGTMI